MFARYGMLLCAIGLLLAVPTAAIAQSAADWKTCEGNDDTAAIIACTKFVNATDRTRRRDAFYNRGISHKALGQLDDAIGDYTRALEIDPRHAGSFNNRGSLFHDKGEFDKSLADLDKAITIDPKFAFAYNNRGTVRETMGDKPGAIADYRKAITMTPQDDDDRAAQADAVDRLAKLGT